MEDSDSETSPDRNTHSDLKIMCAIFGFKNQKSNIQRQLEVSLLG